MKTFLTLATFLFLTANGKAQTIPESEVPAPVVANFQQNFKNTAVKSWEKEKSGKYLAVFDRNNHEGSAAFSADGALYETRNKVDVKYLPQASITYISTYYANYKIQEVSEIVAPNGRLMYEAKIVKGEEKTGLIFDSIGSFRKKVD